MVRETSSYSNSMKDYLYFFFKLHCNKIQISGLSHIRCPLTDMYIPCIYQRGGCIDWRQVIIRQQECHEQSDRRHNPHKPRSPLPAPVERAGGPLHRALSRGDLFRKPIGFRFIIPARFWGRINKMDRVFISPCEET